MSHKVLLVSVLALSLVAFGQTGAVNQPTTSQPQTQPIPAGGGLGVTGGTVGYYGEGVAVSGPLLTTPTASFDSPLPTAGISDAGRAGISDSTPINAGVQTTLNSSTLVYSSVGTEGATTVNPATSAVTERGLDLGPSFFSENIGAGEANGPSLAEIADRYRSLQGTQTLKTYTNADVRPPRTAAAEEERLLAANRPPGLPAAPTQAAASNTQTPQNAGNTTQAQSATGNERLPASASPLPLLGLLGLMSTGAGLWLRGTRRRMVSKVR